MGPLQLGVPCPSMVPKDWPLKVIDLKYFFGILLQDSDKEKFTFTVPKYNHDRPTARYQWCVLPQDMLSSPTLCQEFVDRALLPVRQQYPPILLHHYMDDILLAAPTVSMQQEAYQHLSQLSLHNL